MSKISLFSIKTVLPFFILISFNITLALPLKSVPVLGLAQKSGNDLDTRHQARTTAPPAGEATWEERRDIILGVYFHYSMGWHYFAGGQWRVMRAAWDAGAY
jgi:hypothetical protein